MRPPTAAIGVGVIGLAFGEHVHLPGWDSLRDQGVEIVSVCGRHAERAAAAAERFRAASSTTDWREVVADAAVSIVSIATPPATHVEISTAALHAGKAVLCEKPLGLDAAAAQSVAETRGPPVLVDFSFRALPELRAVRERLASAPVDGFSITWHVAARDNSNWRWSWKDSAAGGGGALAMYGVHVLDYVEWLLGPIVEVQADVTQATATRLDDDGASRPVAADEAFRAHLVLDDGTQGDLDVSLIGTTSLHRLELGGVVLELPAWPGQGPRDGRIEPFSILAGELVAAIREGSRPSPSPLDAVRALTLVEAARASAEQGRPVSSVPIPLSRGSR